MESIEVTKEIAGVFYNDPKMSLKDLAQIEILNRNASIENWHKYVSASNRHFMLMSDDEWAAKIVANDNFFYNWQEDWNNSIYSEFKLRLQHLDIPAESELYVFWMREIGLKTNWAVFCNNWANFLYEDESCILVFPNHHKALVLSNGLAWLGQRNKG